MKSINKALDILEVFRKEKRELSLSEIATLTSSNLSTTHGAVSTLTKRGYLNQRGRRGKYFLGYKLFQLVETAKYENAVWKMAYPHLRELSNLINETVTLSVLNESDNTAIIIQVVRSSKSVSSAGSAEVTMTLHNTGSGKVFLANFNDKEIEKYIAETPLEARTPHSITNPNKLKEELTRIKNDGISIDNQEFELGIVEIAMPVTDSQGKVVAALGIVGPAIKINNGERMEELSITLRRTGAQISRFL